MAESDKWVDRPWLLLVRRKIVVVGIQARGCGGLVASKSAADWRYGGGEARQKQLRTSGIATHPVRCATTNNRLHHGYEYLLT